MTATDHRASRRNQIPMLAQLRIEGEAGLLAIRIRDLSAGGLRAQYAGSTLDGIRIEVELRNIGWVEGRIVWQDERHVGIRFQAPIDSEQARIAVTGNFAAPASPQRVLQRRV